MSPLHSSDITVTCDACSEEGTPTASQLHRVQDEARRVRGELPPLHRDTPLALGIRQWVLRPRPQALHPRNSTIESKKWGMDQHHGPGR